MRTKTILKIIALAVGFAFGVLAAYDCEAFSLRQLRSLNAAASVTNGLSFDGSTAAQMPPQSGGFQWNVFITGSSPNLTFQIQAQMTDGTWVAISPPYYNQNPSITLTGAIPAASQSYSFFGPFLNMRVVITAYTSGTLTADMAVIY